MQSVTLMLPLGNPHTNQRLAGWSLLDFHTFLHGKVSIRPHAVGMRLSNAHHAAQRTRTAFGLTFSAEGVIPSLGWL